jgi:zinc finger SWIM domain-containing protein 3
MLERIRLYAKADLGLRAVLRLLRDDWPDHPFLAEKVSNSLTRARRGKKSELSEAAQLVLLLHDRQTEDDGFFFRKDVEEGTGRLRRLFWMEPQQRVLYLRYQDVVLNDNTANTNRFNMALSTFVVVDANAKSRIVACALVSGETTEDYEWILEQLLESSSGVAPGVLLVDEDPAMEAASANIIPQTTVLNCIWHLCSLNLAKNLQGALRSDWQTFLPRFWTARNALTPDEFDRMWSALARDFGGRNRTGVESYLQRLYDRRQRWAWAWVGSHFTAGMQSTQRVEKSHDLIKREVRRTTPLKDLFGTIERRISDENLTNAYLNFMAEKTSRVFSSQVGQIFEGVEEMNIRYLGNFALYQMRREMIQALVYEAKIHANPEESQKKEADDLDEGGAVSKPSVLLIKRTTYSHCSPP